MSSRRSRRRTVRPPCDDLGPDDGIDPRILFGSAPRRSRDERKLRQLCAQVARAVGFALTGACRDPVLQQLDVLAVEPAPDAGRLRVVVRPISADVTPDDAMRRLGAAHGLLRAAVASEVHRRRAPDLVFEVRPPEEVSP